MPLIRPRWRYYKTKSGVSPVRSFLNGLDDNDLARVTAEMRGVAADGLSVARHLRGDIYEVRADGVHQSFRLLFAPEGSKGRILLALEVFSKRTQKTPPQTIDLAEKRLADWRAGG